MKGINYLFKDFAELAELLEENAEERLLALPGSAQGVAEGDWVLASVNVGDEAFSVAARTEDRGEGLLLTFEDRDWEKLERFAGGRAPQSGPPSLPPPPCEETLRPIGAHILLVDQDPDTQAIVQALLEDAGYRVTCAESGEHAFDVLRHCRFDLLLLEISLPGMSGFDFCRRIRRDRRLSSVPVVFLSTLSTEESLVEAFEVGADDYMTKPFRVPELSARVFGLLRRSRMPAHTGNPSDCC